MNTLELITLAGKLTRHKDVAIQMFLNNFYKNFPDWTDEQKKQVMLALVDSFEKTIKDMD